MIDIILGALEVTGAFLLFFIAMAILLNAVVAFADYLYSIGKREK